MTEDQAKALREAKHTAYHEGRRDRDDELRISWRGRWRRFLENAAVLGVALVLLLAGFTLVVFWGRWVGLWP